MTQTIILTQLQALGASITLAAILFLLGYHYGFFKIEGNPFSFRKKIVFSDFLGGFIIFLGTELALFPSIAYLALSFQKGELLDISSFKPDLILQGWLNLLAVLVSAVSIFLYTLALGNSKRETLFGPPQTKILKNLSIGALVWIFSFPWVASIGQLIELIFNLVGPEKHVDQLAVQNLKTSLTDNTLFYTTTFAIILVVPIAEEILFRGLMQRWLVEILGKWKGIAITAFLFSIFHFSTTQKYDNIALLLSLFVLACFLGFIYEKQGTLWAPIGLHMTFNAISVIMIVMGELAR